MPDPQIAASVRAYDAVAELRAHGLEEEAEAVEAVLEERRRMRAALEDIAGGRREFDLTPTTEDFDFVGSFWFVVKLAEGVVGEA